MKYHIKLPWNSNVKSTLEHTCPTGSTTSDIKTNFRNKINDKACTSLSMGSEQVMRLPIPKHHPDKSLQMKMKNLIHLQLF